MQAVRLLKKERKEREKREKKERAQGGGANREMVIGLPTNFQHNTHIGWDEQKGFQVRSAPAPARGRRV